MVVLVTRPEAQGIELCQQLNEQGITALHHPLITIEAGSGLSDLLPDIHRCDTIIAVSQHAVEFSDQYLRQQQSNWSTSTRYLAVGQKTAHLLSKVTGQSVNYPQVSDSEHLLELAELQDISGQKIIILRGNGGRELIHETLNERGAVVTYKEVYQRRDLPFNANLSSQQWQQAQVDTLIITSGHQLAFFMSQLDSHTAQWACQLKLLVPSERIAKDAKTMGFEHIVVTRSAANPDLVAALQP
ncbi:uroporphyrinogen-III synthase [Vibrio ziniensis]|uniref:Uroporphyrinogen-III synthase n=1 Tax=Vibrio ziniensis TaxID=2711221 RepID=A0A6G7CLY4_9VIBR|nr:uroporphyrinogen-III synthase [Vibrio ziniensis]QIH43058.1 uroporphyrinogen-III synthase [Vibrio ziniensis]